MKKHLCLLAVGALALTACTSEGVLEDVASSRSAIKFEYVVNKPSRADLTSSNLKQFAVFGYYTLPGKPGIAHEVFHDVSVTRNDDNTWEYETAEVPLRYWLEDARYYFYAYSCGSVTKLNTEKYGTFTMDMDDGLTPADRVLIINNYVCDNNHQHDLIYASNTGATEDDQFAGILGLGKDKDNANAPVAFQFKHLLSKVKARFTTSFGSEYEVVVRNVSIRNIRNIGSYHPQSGWQGVDRTEGDQPFVYLLNSGANDVLPLYVHNKKTGNVQESVETNTAYIIPYGYSGQEGDVNTWVNLYFEIDVYLGPNRLMSKILTARFNPTWLEGYSYVYNVDIAPSTSGMNPIIFTTTTDADGNVVTDWNTDDTPVIIVDNKKADSNN